MQIVCDFSAADGFCRDAHIDIRRETQVRSKLQCTWLPKLETDACRLDVTVLALSLRVAAREDTTAIGP
jgi:hypothetical protein